ncbi:MAG: alcohol dehydrogenase catalytic domain-containing protein [Caldilineaceae bacterium]|nr:alcohol dehydrogenase catalytic domain-containing protein [Caldilineaceae bacterium]
MRALTLTDEGLRLVRDYPVPAPRPGEALIRVRLAGVCSTDLQLLAGYKGGYRGVLGHEFVGEVVAAPGAEAWIGRRVVGELNVGCGDCDLCRRGLGKHCRERDSLGIIGRDGAFADYLTLPVANLHSVPADLPDEKAVFAEPLAAALEILEQIHIRPTDRVVVLGDGRLGLLVAQVVAATACALTVIGRTADKLAILNRRGITATLRDPVNSVDPAVKAKFEALLHQPADVVIEVTGSPGGFAQALQLVRPMGVLALKSTFAGTLPDFDISRLVVDEISLIGSRCGPFAPALGLLARDAVAVEPLIHARYGLDDAEAALEHAGRRGVLKVLIGM